MISISGLAAWSSVLYMFLAIAVLLLMVLIHELGHYIAGRIFKFKINEFAVGFGKVLFQRTNKRGEKISLRLFPLGGFCAFEGEGDGEEDELKPDSFNAQKPWKRIIVYAMGPLFNIISAVLFSFVLLFGFGFDVPQVAIVNTTDYATASQFEVGDVIEKIDGVKVDFTAGNSFAALVSQQNAGVPFSVTVIREGQSQEITAVLVPEKDDNGNVIYQKDELGNIIYDEDEQPIVARYVIGISTTPYKHTFWQALARAVPFTIGLAWVVLKSIFMAFTFQLPAGSVTGPIGAIGTIAQQTSANFANLFLLLPLISVNLGVFNLLPIPALDGSHIVFTTIEWIRRKPINRNVEAYIHFFGFVALIAMVILFDVLHLLS